MGLIGIRIRIAEKEKLIPEFEFKQKKEEKVKQDAVPTIKDESIEKKSDEPEHDDKPKTEPEHDDKPKTETEQIKIDAEKMKSIETMEEEENKLKK